MVQLTTAAEEFDIHHDFKCGLDQCQLDIVTVTDISAPSDEKIQVFISGAFHGNERVGPHVSYYLIEYLASNFNKDPRITYLLQNREIVITPMTNSYGFYFNIREEMVKTLSNPTKLVDPNRDFPYNNSE